MKYQAWYDRVFSYLTGFGRWLHGAETNTLQPEEYEKRPYRVLFTRLSTYFDTAHSFAHTLLYQLAAATPGIFPDLAYLPPRQDLKIFRRDNIPWLIGTQSKRGAEDFDMIGFSNSIVQELLNLPLFLRSAKIPLDKKTRLQRADIPLILLGGANALHSSVAWVGDEWVDAVFIGEDTHVIRSILETCRDGKNSGLDKTEILERLAQIPGILIPQRPGHTARMALTSCLDDGIALENAPLLFDPEQLGAAHLQIDEGCPYLCSFCSESWTRKPYRTVSQDKLVERALKMKALMGLDEIEIHSTNFNVYPGLERLLWRLVPYFKRIGLKSQRLDILAQNPGLIAFLRALGKANFTVGLEGISPRLRRYLHKNLADEEIVEGLTAIFKNSPRELKIFLIASGLEEQDDFAELGKLLDFIQELHQGNRRATRVIFSLTPLVRFPCTPLEFTEAYPIAHYVPIIRQIEEQVGQRGFECRLAASLAEYWVAQVLARAGDGRIARALLKTLDDAGFVYFRTIDRRFQEAFAANLEKTGLPQKELLRGSPAVDGQSPPLLRIDTGVKRDFLLSQANKALSFEEIPACLDARVQGETERCRRCGACASIPVHPNSTHTRSHPEQAFTAEQLRQRIEEYRRKEIMISFLVDVQPIYSFLPAKMPHVDLARALLIADPALTPLYRGSALKSAGIRNDGLFFTLEGEEVITLVWDQEALPLITAAISRTDCLERVNRLLSGKMEWLRLAPEDWQVSRLVVDSPFSFDPEPFLKKCSVKYMKRKISPTEWSIEPAGASRHNKYISTLSWSITADKNVRVELSPGLKFNAGEFVRLGFVIPDPASAVRIKMRIRGTQRGTPGAG